MPVAIVTDTCHYLPRELVTANEIHEVSLYVHRDGVSQRESEITDYDAYYERLGTSAELPTTSQPSIGDFLAVYEPLLDAGNEIVSIHLAGGMSGTVSAASQAREALGDRAERVFVDRFRERVRRRGTGRAGGRRCRAPRWRRRRCRRRASTPARRGPS